MSRQRFIAGNWKMHKPIREAEAFIHELLPLLDPCDDLDVALCVPFTALQATVDAARGKDLEIFAQTMHEARQGAFTGEISAEMLTEIDVDGVLLGHSERRQLFGETDRALQAKVARALENGLKPVLCVGETEEERERGDTERKLRTQVQEGLHAVATERLGDVIVAYEPIWAIGTGIVATSEQAQEACAFVRALVAQRSREAGEQVRVLYGGSVNPGNAAELLGLPDVDGALVGGASLDPEQFAAIVAAAKDATADPGTA
jgi:triosephosphate isomerase